MNKMMNTEQSEHASPWNLTQTRNTKWRDEYDRKRSIRKEEVKRNQEMDTNGRDEYICLFCKRDPQKRRYSAKETYNFKEPTNRSHPIRNEETNTKWRDHEITEWIRTEEINKEGNTDILWNLTQTPNTKFKDEYEMKRSIRKEEVNKESNTEKQ